MLIIEVFFKVYLIVDTLQFKYHYFNKYIDDLQDSTTCATSERSDIDIAYLYWIPNLS